MATIATPRDLLTQTAGQCARFLLLALLFAATAVARPFPSFGTSPAEPWALPVAIRSAPAFDAVMLSMRGSYSQHEQALDRLRRELHRLGVDPAGDPFGRYLNDPAQTPEQDLRWEVGFPVSPALPALQPAPPFELRHFDTRLVASLQVHGPYRENGLRWPTFYQWLVARGYQQTDASMESWSVSSTPDGFSTGQTEMHVPVRRVAVVPLLLRYVVCLWGSCVFLMFSWLYLRQYPRGRPSLWNGPLWVLLCLACVILYFQPLFSELIYLYSAVALMLFHAWSAAVAGIVIPPLLVHLFFRITRERLPQAWIFRWAVAAMYCASGVFVVSLRLHHTFWDHLDRTLHVANGYIALAAAICLSMVLLAPSSKTTSVGNSERRTYVSLLGATVALSLFGAIVNAEASRELSDAALRALPLLFLFAAMYYNERAVFFDIVAKRGVFVFAAIALLTAYFALIPARLVSVRLGWVGMWVYPLSALPLLVIAPWAYRRLSSLLDRYWLGRTLSPAAAQQFFLNGLGKATTEEELVRAAERGLTSVYRGSFQITLGNNPAAQEDAAAFVAPIATRGERLGTIRMGSTPGGRVLLSEDRKHLASLADSFALMLENFRLREKKLLQESREQELRLHASRAELRALRAQINPHFLFNALNSIAALIAEDPRQAEVTVERLSELFRYTLRNWEGEWVRLEEEMAFVRCYLDVEKTRFKRRLDVSVEQDHGTGEVLVPALIVQTLVENAVKHGVTPMRGVVKVEVRIKRDDGALRVEVRDTGPGFSPNSEAGYGLRNAQERLRGHFGDSAQLTIARDVQAGITAVGITMPVVLVPPAEAQTVP